MSYLRRISHLLVVRRSSSDSGSYVITGIRLRHVLGPVPRRGPRRGPRRPPEASWGTSPLPPPLPPSTPPPTSSANPTCPAAICGARRRRPRDRRPCVRLVVEIRLAAVEPASEPPSEAPAPPFLRLSSAKVSPRRAKPRCRPSYPSSSSAPRGESSSPRSAKSGERANRPRRRRCDDVKVRRRIDGERRRGGVVAAVASPRQAVVDVARPPAHARFLGPRARIDLSASPAPSGFSARVVRDSPRPALRAHARERGVGAGNQPERRRSPRPRPRRRRRVGVSRALGSPSPSPPSTRVVRVAVACGGGGPAACSARPSTGDVEPPLSRASPASKGAASRASAARRREIPDHVRAVFRRRQPRRRVEINPTTPGRCIPPRGRSDRGRRVRALGRDDGDARAANDADASPRAAEARPDRAPAAEGALRAFADARSSPGGPTDQSLGSVTHPRLFRPPPSYDHSSAATGAAPALVSPKQRGPRTARRGTPPASAASTPCSCSRPRTPRLDRGRPSARRPRREDRIRPGGGESSRGTVPRRRGRRRRVGPRRLPLGRWRAPSGARS